MYIQSKYIRDNSTKVNYKMTIEHQCDFLHFLHVIIKHRSNFFFTVYVLN